jgi:putative salt-induced outer membrane protein YdiY
MRVLLGVMASLLACATLASADTVIFKNGDKLSGTFIEMQDKKLTFKSDAVGDVSIALEKIQSLSVQKPAVLLGSDRKPIRGQIELQESGDWQVTSNGASQTVGAGAVEIVLTQDAYHAEVEAPATLWQDWSGSINFGYAIQSGDEKSSTLSGSVIATRERPHDLVFMRHWRTNYGLNMLFARAREDGELVNSDAITTNLRQDYLFSSRDFVFGTAQLDHINAQGLYLRQTYGGGLGRDFIHTNRTLFSATGGAAYIREKFVTGPFNQSSEGAIGEKLSIQMNSRLHFVHTLGFFPDLEHRSRYHADASANLALKINRRFVANAGAIDQYISKPAPGTKNNNVAFTTGLGYTF